MRGVLGRWREELADADTRVRVPSGIEAREDVRADVRGDAVSPEFLSETDLRVGREFVDCDRLSTTTTPPPAQP